MANKALGNKLRELRKSNNFTQQQVADILGLKNKSTLGSWEVGKSEPDAMTFLRLCEIYNVKDIMFEFLGYKQEIIVLNDKEKQLLSDFKSMSSQGQEYILQTVDMAKDKYAQNSANIQKESQSHTIADDITEELKQVLRKRTSIK